MKISECQTVSNYRNFIDVSNVHWCQKSKGLITPEKMIDYNELNFDLRMTSIKTCEIFSCLKKILIRLK